VKEIEPVRLGALACLLLLGAAAVSCGTPRRNVVVQATEVPLQEAVEVATEVRHVAQAGQTLWRIARVYGVSVETLVRANGLDDPSSLEIGQILLVPGATALLDVPAYPAPLDGSSERRASSEEPPRFEWPVADGRILSGYGAPRRGRTHKGLDIGGKRGQPVCAAAAGRVVYSGSTLRGYGKTVIIDHGGELQSLYAHNSDLLAREGQRVDRGQAIARLGRTGNASTEHVHFEVRRNDVPVDPLHYLTRRTEGTR
jgi:murein DD-endopeptidase MepM/ murein hydrolase activator NlpD